MRRLVRLLPILGDFAGMIFFFLLLHFAGLKAAIIGALAAIAIGAWWRWRSGKGFDRLWLVLSGLTLVFGLVDLTVETPFLIRFEAVITNVVIGAAFTVGAFGAKPMVQEFAEKGQGAPFPPDRRDLKAFFRAFTLVWAGYFYLKALVYVLLALALPFEDMLLWRALFGNATMVLMMAISVKGRAVYGLCRRLGWFVPQQGVEAPAPAQ